MKFYTNVFRRGDNLYVRKVENGKRDTDIVPYKPYVFVTPKPNSTTEWKDFNGNPIVPLQPGSMRETSEFVEKYKGVTGFDIYCGDYSPVYQFINCEYPEEIRYDFNKIVVHTIDIETATEGGFPKVDLANEEILLISVKTLNNDSVDVFTSRQYETDQKNVTIHLCADESSMLRRFIQFMGETQPDVITGWNIDAFDIPYIVNRISNVLSAKEVQRLSPWKHVKEVKKRTRDAMAREYITYSIGGIAILDYLSLYKKFVLVPRERYTLDHIAYAELGENKLDHSEYDTFKDFYTQNWKKFVDYNIRDVELVHRLEKKLKLIELATIISYMAKTNYEDVYSPVRIWDSIVHNYLWNQKTCIPNKFVSNKDAPYDGAYVQEPVVGFHNWVVSFDATSLYPSIMQTWNISPETLVEVDSSREVPIEWYLKKDAEVPDDGNAHCINGASFSREKKGVFYSLISFYMTLRKKTKNEMLDKSQQTENIPKNSKEYRSLKNDIAYLDVKQQAVKILLNSLYGACGTPYFRYYNIDIARSITMNGQYIIRSVGEALNRELNKKFKTDNYVYNIYCDTDSVYVRLEPIVNKYLAGQSTEKTIAALDKICEDIIRPIINNACNELQDYLHCYDKCISFKREVIADKGIWTAKKHYILNVHNSEGVQYTKPKLKILGLEMIKSSTPEVVRKKLTEAVDIILHGTEDQMRTFVQNFRSVFGEYTAEQLAFPRTANALSEYAGSPIYKKGTPIAVKGALIHNHLVNRIKLNHKYSLISDGEKIKYVYLLKSNPTRETVISFNGELPKEFGLDRYVDHDTMFEKTFLDPLNSIIKHMSWNVNSHSTLDDFFS